MARARPSRLYRHLLYELRGGFLIRPLALALALGAAGAVLSTLETVLPGIDRAAPPYLVPRSDDPQAAQVILGGIAASMMTVVSIVFAILLMTITLASTQFSPRIVVSFVRDRVTQQTLGMFLGTFAFCLCALPTTRSAPQPFAPAWTVLCAMLLALLCVVWLLFFIQHISEAVSVNYLVDRIANETEQMIDELMPPASHSADGARARVPEPGEDALAGLAETPIMSGVSGYVRYVDTARLVALAAEQAFVVRIDRPAGQFVPEGVRMMTVLRDPSSGGTLPATELTEAFDIGAMRTLEQDIDFGVLQIVDVALRAISPAINDPSTAICCIDQLSRILIRFAARTAADPLVRDAQGSIRVIRPVLSFPHMVESAFEQIRYYARTDAAVSLRLLRALHDVGQTIDDDANRLALVECGRSVVAGCTGAVGEAALAEMRARLEALERLGADTIGGRPASS